MGHHSSSGSNKEPSVHSLSSSEVSSTSTTSIHKRSTPKIAAAIIVAFLIIAALAGVTVYFITSKRLMESNAEDKLKETYVEKRVLDEDHRLYNSVVPSSYDNAGADPDVQDSYYYYDEAEDGQLSEDYYDSPDYTDDRPLPEDDGRSLIIV